MILTSSTEGARDCRCGQPKLLKDGGDAWEYAVGKEAVLALLVNTNTVRRSQNTREVVDPHVVELPRLVLKRHR